MDNKNSETLNIAWVWQLQIYFPLYAYLKNNFKLYLKNYGLKVCLKYKSTSFLPYTLTKLHLHYLSNEGTILPLYIAATFMKYTSNVSLISCGNYYNICCNSCRPIAVKVVKCFLFFFLIYKHYFYKLILLP